MKRFLLFILLAAPFVVNSQDLTGTWEGSGGGTTYIKMVLIHKGDSLYGYTYDEGSGFCKASFQGSYSQSMKQLEGNGVTMIERTSNHVLVDYYLHYSHEEDGEYLRERNKEDQNFLERLFGADRAPEYLKKTSNKTDALARSFVPKAKMVVSPRPTPKKVPVTVKVPPPAVKPPVKKPVPSTVIKTVPPKKTVVPKKENPSVQKQETVLKRDSVATPNRQVVKKTLPEPLLKKKEERTSKIVRTIFTTADTLLISVYDNGEVDGDTVTVFLDNKIVLDRYRISDKPKDIKVPIMTGQTRIIDLFANNLGSIPPNTALIIITAGKERHELYASYDLKTNARIVIQNKSVP